MMMIGGDQGAQSSDDLIHDMGDVSHMLPNAIGADLSVSIAEVKDLVESSIERALTHQKFPRLSGAMMHLVRGREAPTSNITMASCQSSR